MEKCSDFVAILKGNYFLLEKSFISAFFICFAVQETILHTYLK